MFGVDTGKAAKIAKLNDRMRQALGMYGRVIATEGFQSLPPGVQSDFQEALATFDAFNTDKNDPYGEHDFGSITLEGIKVFWKIDYFARSEDEPYTWGSPDPSDRQVTDRVLTLMLSYEY